MIVVIAYAGLGWVHALSHGHPPLGYGGSVAAHREHVHAHSPGEAHHAHAHAHTHIGAGAFAIGPCDDEHGDCRDNHCELTGSHCHCDIDHCHHEHVVLSTQPREVRRLGSIDLGILSQARSADDGGDALGRSPLIRPPPHDVGQDHLVQLRTVVLLT